MYLHHYDESSEYATARQHKVAGYRLERILMGCADPPSKGVGVLGGSAHPISVLELEKNEVDGGSLSRTRCTHCYLIREKKDVLVWVIV